MRTTLVFNAVPLAKFIRDNLVAAAHPLPIAKWINGVSERLKPIAAYFYNRGEAERLIDAVRSTTYAKQHHAQSELELHYAA